MKIFTIPSALLLNDIYMLYHFLVYVIYVYEISPSTLLRHLYSLPIWLPLLKNPQYNSSQFLLNYTLLHSLLQSFFCLMTIVQHQSINFKLILNKNVLKFIRFHDLRHSCASLLYAKEVDLKSIQEWLGHSTINTTANIYTHFDFSKKVASANAIMTNFPSIKQEGC